MAETKKLPVEQRFCGACGAANALDESLCFACQRPLEKSEREELLHGRYRLLVQLGSGGSGAVYKGEDVQEQGRIVAVKQIKIGGLGASEAIEATDAFHREVDMLSRLRHPQLPRVQDHFTDKDNWYLITDYIEGETLAAYVEHLVSSKARDGLRLEEVLKVGLQLCDVLDYLHSREPSIIFRDLKPSNIIRTSKGQLYLIDFGIARYFNPLKTRDTIPLGSPGYAAPEQYGRAQTTTRADIYSLGAVLYELVSGIDPAENPFRFAPFRRYGGEGWSELEALIMQMVELDASKRPASIREVKATLQQISELVGGGSAQRIWTPGPGAVPPVTWQPFGEQDRQSQQQQMASLASIQGARLSRRRIIAGGIAAAGLLAGGGVYSWYRNSVRSEEDLLYSYQGHLKGKGRYHNVPSLSWSPDGRYIASGDASGSFQVWMALDGRQLLVRDIGALVTTVDWSPAGTEIATGSRANIVQIWTRGRRIVEKQNGATNFAKEIIALAWSPRGEYLAAADDADTVRIWDIKGADTHTFEHKSVKHLTWSPDGGLLAVGGLLVTAFYSVSFNPLGLTADDTFRELAVQAPSEVKWSHGGGRLAASSYNGDQVFIYDQDGFFRRLDVPDKNYTISSLAWSPFDSFLAGIYGDTIIIWHVNSGEAIYTYHGHGSDVSALAWSPTENTLASSDMSGEVQIWRPKLRNR